MVITPSQAGALLHRHATEISSLRLFELCQDANRVTSMVAVHNSTTDDEEDHLLLVDFSRQKMTLDTINHLLLLSAALQLRERIRDLAWGRLASGVAQKTQQSYTNRFYSGDNDGLLSPTVSFAQDTNDKARSFRDDDAEPTQTGGSMHLSLRMPSNRGMYVACPYASSQKPKNALDEIHSEWKRIRSLSSSIRQGNIRGASGSPLCDVLVVSGSGTVVSAALEFVYRALLQNDSAHKAASVNSSLVTHDPSSSSSTASSNAPSKTNVEAILQNIVKTPFKSGMKTEGPSHAFHNTPLRTRKLRILTSVDPTAWAEATADLSPATTCVITLAVDDMKDEECKLLTLLVRSWLQNGAEGASDVTRKQMYLVTNQERNNKANPNNSFLIPRHCGCEAFLSFSAAGLLPLSVLFGWDMVASFLSGAHSIDRHFVETNPRHNLPVLLGLVDVWNDVFLNSRGRVIAPYLQALGSYPAFVSVLENNVLNARQVGALPDWNLKRNKGSCVPSSVIDGGPHSRYRYSQGEDAISTEFVTALDPTQTRHGADGNGGGTTNDKRIDNNDERICSMFGYADTLAFGSCEISKHPGHNGNGGLLSPGSPPAIQSCDSMLSVSSGINGPGGNNVSTALGNRPSTLIICGQCDAFACGQLLAMAEHRVLVKAWLWNIDPFESFKPLPSGDSLRDGLKQMYLDLAMHGTLEEDEDDVNADNSDGIPMNVSTRTILKHYATRMHKHKNNASGMQT
ncbi:hypothetical protein ACHAW6_016212 [Cyclotella cf. meneghiniana]